MAVLERGPAADVGMSAERLELAHELMREQVSSGRAPSVAAVVLRHGNVVMEAAYGVQRPDGPALTVDHVWAIASAGKPLTAATVLSLVEEGRIGVMEPIIDHLPELAGSGNDEVLVHHLLTHSAGWESDMFGGRLEAVLRSGELPPPPTGSDVITHLVLWLALHPVRIAGVGEQMAYGNVSYSLLGEIVRRVTGGSLDAAMRERVLEPLGMARSALIVDDDLRPHLVQRARHLPFASGAYAFQGHLWEASDAGESGVHASPRDLARFGQAILDGGMLDGRRILAPTTVRSMCVDQIPGLAASFGPDRVVPVASWGYGFGVICEQRWAYFGGGLVPPGSVSHPGAGGISYWIDFDHGIVGVFFEVLTEITEDLEPLVGMGNRFQDVITGAVVA
jgi:CubicO group peptidase (beta-lactamase class C family)